ncbi:MAG TPA: 4'-phosphopantetheinyl transferase superfamily protein [Streptosporangiaceae bacterium]
MTARHRCDIYLAQTASLRSAHLALLDAAERARAAGYLRTEDRDRFALGAVLLRAVASRRLGSTPVSLTVERGCERCGRQHGRPRLPQAPGLHASVSHSGAVVAVALTGAGAVGVDVEAMSAGRAHADELAGVVCSGTERGEVRHARDFCVYWTRKEAVLKATGEGLRRPLTEVHVSPPRAAPRLLALAGSQPACQLADLPIGPGYQGAVAVLTDMQVECVTTDAGALLQALAAVG